MKNTLVFLLVFVMLLSLLASCNSETPDLPDGSVTDPPASDESDPPTPDEEEKPTPNPVSDFEYSLASTGNGIAILKYVGTSKSIVFPDTIDGLPVTIIGGFLLDVEKSLLIESVVIPDTVQLIVDYAFSRCKNLISVDFGKGVREIGNEAFRGCTALKKVILPPSLESIGASVFSDCTAIEEIFIPQSLTNWNYFSVHDGLFSGYEKPSALKKITIDDGLVSLGSQDGAGIFANAPLLEELVIPASVTSIEPFAFHSCTGLKSVTFLGDAPEVTEHVFGYAGTETSSENLLIYYDPDTKGWDNTLLLEYTLVPINEKIK